MKNSVVTGIIPVLILFIFSCTGPKKNTSNENFLSKKERKPDRSGNSQSSLNGSGASSVAVSAKNHAKEISTYVLKNGYSAKYCFLVDMSLPSGRNRFFVYDLQKNSVAFAGLVAHGTCNETYLSYPRFSNTPNGKCSSLGRYKIGGMYRGKYGKSYRLYGLENSNSNAFRRGVVIHGFVCVPEEEIYPRVLCNSEGCPMVSYSFLNRLSRIIDKSDKPIVLWVYR